MYLIYGSSKFIAYAYSIWLDFIDEALFTLKKCKGNVARWTSAKFGSYLSHSVIVVCDILIGEIII